MINAFPYHIIYSHYADYSIAINTTNWTERQQFSADCESKIWILRVFFKKKPKNLKFGLLGFFSFFCKKKLKNLGFNECFLQPCSARRAT